MAEKTKKMIWFKFWAADYLLDRDVDDLPLEAQAILVRMWAVACIEGSIPSDEAEIARKCRLRADQQLHLQKNMQKLVQFFTPFADGLLVSERMREEWEHSQHVSEVRSEAGKASHKEGVRANASAKRRAKGPAKKLQSESESDKYRQQPENSDEAIWNIARLHPGNSHLQGEHELPQNQLAVLVERCEEDGVDAVQSGTVAFRDAWDAMPPEKRDYLSSELKDPAKFFRSRCYRKYKSEPKREEQLTDMDRVWCGRFDIPYEGRPISEVKAEITRRRAEGGNVIQ